MPRSFLFLTLFIISIPVFPIFAAEESSPTVFGGKLRSASIYRRNRKEALEKTDRAQEKYNELKGGATQEIRQKLSDNAKEIITKRLDAALEHLRAFLQMARGSDRLTDAEKSVAEDVVSDFETLAEDYKQEISAAESLDELKAIFARVRVDVRKTMSSIGATTGFLNASRANKLIDRMDAAAGKLKAHIDAAAAAGGDTAEATEIYDEGAASLESAKKSYDAALAELKNSPEVDMKKVREYMQSANVALRSAHNSFSTATSLLRDLYKVTPWEVE